MQTTSNPTTTPAQLFFDGKCPLCTKEMARLSALKSEALTLVDIHTLEDSEELPDTPTLLRTLHLRTPEGALLTGVAANIAAWQYTGHGKWLRWMRWPLIRQISDWCYDLWARWRYHRLYGNHCPPGGAACDAPR